MLTVVLNRLSAALKAAGVPFEGVAIKDPSPEGIRIDYTKDATPRDVQTATAILAGFDWSPGADEIYLRKQSVVDAQTALTASGANPSMAMGFAMVTYVLQELKKSNPLYQMPSTLDILSGINAILAATVVNSGLDQATMEKIMATKYPSPIVQTVKGVYQLGFNSAFGPTIVGQGDSWLAAMLDAQAKYPTIWTGVKIP